MINNLYLSVLTPAVSTGAVSFLFQTYNATPNTSITVTATGIIAGMSEKNIASTLCQQASAQFAAQGLLFQGVMGTLTDPIAGYWQTAFTDHCIDFFSLAQYQISQVSDTTGASYYIDSTPVLCTVAEAMSYGPLADQLLQTCSGGALSTTQVIDLLAMASSEITGILRNNIVSSWYVYELTTNIMNAIQFDNRPIQFMYNPYTLRPTIIAMATQVATFDLKSRYEVDFRTGWCTFRFAQDMLFNYEPFDMNNQWRVAYQAGWNYIPREIKTAVLKWSYVLQTFSNIEEFSDGVTKVKYSIDKNIQMRNIFTPLKGRYTQ